MLLYVIIATPDKSIDLCADVRGSRHENRRVSLCVSSGKKCFSRASRSGVPSAVSRPFIGSHVCGDVVCAIVGTVYTHGKRRGYARLHRLSPLHFGYCTSLHLTLAAAPGTVISACCTCECDSSHCTCTPAAKKPEVFASE